MPMSTEKSVKITLQNTVKKRVFAMIDGFNLYHALIYFRGGATEEERAKYQKYKWICFRTLISRFLDLDKEELSEVILFTSYPYWDQAKRMRQQTYLTALKYSGVRHVLGEFKENWIECRATCKESFDKPAEKQTDVNIAISIIEYAKDYDVLILITGDSDQVPAIRVLKKLYPEKTVYILPPIGRNSKELVRAAGKNSRKIMKEEDLAASFLPNPVEGKNEEGKLVQIWKPASW
jgi:uncharacterized LabA/DUF88 family protein